VSSTFRANNILLVQWFLIVWGRGFPRGYVGSVSEMQGMGCNSPRIAGTEDLSLISLQDAAAQIVPALWGFGLKVT